MAMCASNQNMTTLTKSRAKKVGKYNKNNKGGNEVEQGDEIVKALESTVRNHLETILRKGIQHLDLATVKVKDVISHETDLLHILRIVVNRLAQSAARVPA